VALLASAEAYTPTAQRLIDGMRERLGSINDVANALADNLPAPKQHSGKARRRRRKRKQRDRQPQQQQQQQGQKKQEQKQPQAQTQRAAEPEAAGSG
jgi:uncharacterized membrane protein (UPF0182 family)